MRKGLIYVMFFLLSFVVHAAAAQQVVQLEIDSYNEPINIGAVNKNIQDTIRFATVAPDSQAARDKLKGMLRYSLHLLRGPNPDGKTYRYSKAKFDGNDPVLMKSEKLTHIWDSGEPQIITIETSITTGFQIRMPLQRGIFKNNGSMYLDSYKVEYVIDGEKRIDAKDFKKWLTKDSTIEVPLPGIAEKASLRLVTGVSKQDRDHTIVHIYARFPEYKDDPKNPFDYSMGQLREALIRMEQGRPPREVVRFQEEAKSGIAAIPSAVSHPTASTSNSQIVQKLEYILYLLQGSPDEKNDAVENLKDLIRSLK